MNQPVPDWVGALTVVVCLGGSVAFGLWLHASRRGGRDYQAATQELLQAVARRLGGTYTPVGQTWSLYKSIRVFGAAAGTRGEIAYEVSRYPLNVEDDGGRPYIALRTPAGGPKLSPLGDLTSHAYGYKGTLIILSPDTVWTPSNETTAPGLAHWAGQILDLGRGRG